MDYYFDGYPTDNYHIDDPGFWSDRHIDAYYEDYMERNEDMVNSPDHYTHNGIEAIEVIEAKLTNDQYQGYLQGSVMKYLLRSNYKGKRNEDLKKAQWYLNVLVNTNNLSDKDKEL